MKYTTMDIEFADVILPSICSITILDWEEGEIVKSFSTLINPDCEVEDFLFQRHGLTYENLQDKPTLPMVWKQIYDMLSDKIVFIHNANVTVSALKRDADIEYLNMPNFIFCCTASLSNRVWPHFRNSSLQYVTERLGITDKHFNSFEDAKSVGIIVKMAMEDLEVNNLYDFFTKVGFAGGMFIDGERKIYRAKKYKDKYLARFKADMQAIDWDNAYQNQNKNIVLNTLYSLE